MLPTSFAHFDPLDNLPYIDYGITPQERRRVEELVQHEVSQVNTDQMHPAVLPLSSNMDRFRRRQIPEENGQSGSPDSVEAQTMPQGIDMTRYSEFHEGAEHENDNDADSDNGESINHDRMYTSLAYSVLRERSASLAVQNDESIGSVRDAHLERLSQLESSYSTEVDKKRQRIEDINEARKKRQLDFQPVNEYLDEKWHDGVNSMVDMGIQRHSDS